MKLYRLMAKVYNWLSSHQTVINAIYYASVILGVLTIINSI